MKLSLSGKNTDPTSVLCLGAHSDDIEIGCGGTLLHLQSAFPRLQFHWVVFSTQGPRGKEAAKGAELFTAGCHKEVVLKDYRDGFLPYHGGEVKDFFEEMKGRVDPDLDFHPLAWRCPPGSPIGFRTDLEYFSESFHP